MSELLLPFALLRIKALENAVAGHQTQLNELRPLRADVLDLHSAVSELREAQAEQEDRLSADIAALGDQVATLEHCVEENDAKLNSVQTAVLEDHVEAAVAIDERFRMAKRHSLEEGSSTLLRDVLQLEQQVVGAPPRSQSPALQRVQAARAESGADGREAEALEDLQKRASEEALDLAAHVKALESRLEECFLLVKANRREGSQLARAGSLQGAQAAGPRPRAGAVAAGSRLPSESLSRERGESEFDDDVGEAERPVPRPCQSRRACSTVSTSPAGKMAVQRQNALY